MTGNTLIAGDTKLEEVVCLLKIRKYAKLCAENVIKTCHETVQRKQAKQKTRILNYMYFI